MGTVDIQRAGQDVGVDLAGVARLLADGTRAAFCLALLDGRAWTANELARYAEVAPSTATSHLNLLVNGGLLVEERHGRHRYVRVADRRVVELIESLAALAPKHSAPPRSLSASGRMAGTGPRPAVLRPPGRNHRTGHHRRDGRTRTPGVGARAGPDRQGHPLACRDRHHGACRITCGHRCAHASTGPSAVSTWLALWAPPCLPTHSPPGG